MTTYGNGDKISTGETRYEYVGSSLAYQVTTNVNGAVEQELYFFYDASGNLSVIRQVTPTKDYHFYVTTNTQGDVLGIYSATGTLLASYEYDAWGNCTVSYDNPTYNIGETNPIRYRGYYYNSETELYYLQSRYYDPEIGRFLNADGYVSTDVTDPLAYNMYAYCQNNPVMFLDICGYVPCFVLEVALSTEATLRPSMPTNFPTSPFYIPELTIPESAALPTGMLVDFSPVVATPTIDAREIRVPAKQLNFGGKQKKAKEAAKRVAGGKEPIHHPKSPKNKRGHYHPNVKNEYSKTPHDPCKHDHYYYSIFPPSVPKLTSTDILMGGAISNVF